MKNLSSKEINLYIAKNHKKKSVEYLANLFGKTENAIRIRILRIAGTSAIKQIREPKNTYSNACGVKKQQAREIMINAIKVHGLIPSLPFSTCELESQILARNPNAFKFIGCEMDRPTFIEMLKTIDNDERLINAITPYLGMIGDLLMNAKKDAFSNLILDYCGILETFAKEIEFVIKNNLVKAGGAICVTLAKRGSSKEENIFNDINKNIPTNLFDDNVGEVERAIRVFFINLVTNNPNYSIETFFPYQDDKKEEGRPVLNKNGTPIKNAPMVLFVLRRNK